MHKYVVMAHAEGPNDKAQQIRGLASERGGTVDVIMTNPGTEEMYDLVGVIDVDGMTDEDVTALDQDIHDLGFAHIETFRSEPHDHEATGQAQS